MTRKIISPSGQDVDIVPGGAGLVKIKNTVGIDAIIDDDTMATATDSNVPTAESIKTYVDNLVFNANPIGTIIDFAGTVAPTGHLACNGQVVSRTTYAALFAVIGTTWGAGDGSTTFNLPDFRRRVAVGSGGTGTGTLANTVGSTGGAETHTLTTAQLASHTHTYARTTISAADLAPGGSSTRPSGETTPATGSAGSGSAHNIMQPSAVVLRCIKYA